MQVPGRTTCADSATRRNRPSIRPSDQRTPLIRADAPAHFRSTPEGPAHAPAPHRHPHPRLRSPPWSASVLRSWPARRTAARTTRGRRSRRRGDGRLARVVLRLGPDPPGVLRRPARLVRRARPGPGRSLRVGRQPQHRLRLRGELGQRRRRARTDGSGSAPAPVRSTNGETGTNVQEAGVDEPDVVKTDGKTLFRVQDGDLVTYDVSGAEVRAARLVRPARGHRRRQHRDPALRRHRGRALAAGRRRPRRPARSPSW